MRTFHALIGAAVLAALAVPAAAQFRQPGSSVGQRHDSDQERSLYDAARFGRLGTASGAYATPDWRRQFFVGGVGEQGFNPARTGIVDQGLSLTPPLLRDLPSAPRLGPDGLASQQTGAYLGYRRDNLLLSSSLRQDFSASGAGPRMDLGATYGFNLTPRHLITLSGGLTLGQSHAVAPYTSGFTADSVGRWGYRIGEPGAGFRLSWLYSWDRNVYLGTTLGYDRAYGDGPEGVPGGERGAASVGTVFGYRW
jgi:hypothetical protein